MSPIQTSKRRRLNTATNTLSQPFKSPFKTPLKQNLGTTTSSPSANSPPPTSSTPLTNSSTNNKPTTSQASPLKPQPQPPSTKTPRPHPNPQPNHHHHQPSTHLTTLQSKHTALLSRLSASRAALETSTQALNIEFSNRDGELELLIKKWRLKSREAAEMVFVGVKERVERAGGVKGLKGRERGGGSGWGWDEPGKGDGRDVNGGKEGLEDEGEEETDVEKEKEEEEEGAEEGEYTMDMMLKSLNIDLGIIGFDKKAQKWVD